MIKLENIDVWGFNHAIRGMRNPMNSWDKSDSIKCYANANCSGICKNNICGLCIGQNDLDLMKRLYKAGSEHRKYLRQIMVSMDITAPLYWWKEFDTYKVGTVANSCSTMHKIHEKEFTLDDFSHEHLFRCLGDAPGYCIADTKEELENADFFNVHLEWDSDCNEWYEGDVSMNVLNVTIDALNAYRTKYLDTKDKKYWWQMIQLLPSSYNQKRTVTMNYENVMNIIDQRSNHKLDEWRDFVDTLKTLPYVNDIRKETIHE